MKLAVWEQVLLDLELGRLHNCLEQVLVELERRHNCLEQVQLELKRRRSYLEQVLLELGRSHSCLQRGLLGQHHIGWKVEQLGYRILYLEQGHHILELA